MRGSQPEIVSTYNRLRKLPSGSAGIPLAISGQGSNMVAMSISSTLRRAAKLQEKIEGLRGQLAVLLDKARKELDSDVSEVIPAPLRGRSRPKALKRIGGARGLRAGKEVSGNAKAARGRGSKRRSPLAGHKRAASPSGPLAPAVVKVLEKKKQPMNVRDILAQLLANGYAFNSSEPKKNLAARIYRLKGVKQVSAGLFARA